MATWLVKRSAYESVFGLVGFVDDDFNKRDMHYAGLGFLVQLMPFRLWLKSIISIF